MSLMRHDFAGASQEFTYDFSLNCAPNARISGPFPAGEIKRQDSAYSRTAEFGLALSTGIFRSERRRVRKGWRGAVKILICDEQRMLAEALAAALDARGYDILAVTTAVSDAPSSGGDWVPDVCLLGLQPGHQSSGPDTVRAILQRYPGTKVLVLSQITDPETLSHFMRSGVAGVAHQDRSVAQIAAALDAIEAGRSVLDPGPLRYPARDRNRLCDLSPREKEIVTRIAGGQGTRQMSSAMNITVDTVRTYVKNVLAKLGVHSRLQVAALASRDGLLIDEATAMDVFPAAGSRVSRPRRASLPGESLPEERATARRL
jgi:two-component system, NarL family, nitrate/nitrite response regulator NarL